MEFEINGKRYEYAPVIGERCVELPIAFDYIEQFDEDEYFEVGFVLAYHLPCLNIRESTHLVVDKFEKHGSYTKLFNIDIVEFAPLNSYKACFCISTLEHVGWDEGKPHEPAKPLQALSMMRIACDHKFMFATIPMGYNRTIDNYIRDGSIEFDEMMFMKQVESGAWKQVDLCDLDNVRYNKPFPAANGLLIGVDSD